MDNARRWPLSKAQEVFWQFSRPSYGLPGRFNHLPGVVTLRGDLDRRALGAGFERPVARHTALRTLFSDVGEPGQYLGTFEPYEIPFADLRQVAADLRPLERDRLFREAASVPFDLGAERAWRTHLVRLADDHYELFLVAHHLIFDAWSQRIAITELAELYRAERLGEAPQLDPVGTTHFAFAVEERRRIIEIVADQAW